MSNRRNIRTERMHEVYEKIIGRKPSDKVRIILAVVLTTIVKCQVPFSEFSVLQSLSNGPACASSTPDWSVTVRSQFQCINECERGGSTSQCVGVNYRGVNNVCEIFNKCPVVFATNETARCQYFENKMVADSRQCKRLTGPFSLSWMSGNVYVNAGNEVLSSATTNTTFLLESCLAMNEVSASQQPNCVSFTPVGQPNAHLRHINFIFYVQTPPSPLFSYLSDASFILSPDMFYPGTMAFESVNYPGYYINVHADNRLGIDPLQNTVSFKDNATFF